MSIEATSMAVAPQQSVRPTATPPQTAAAAPRLAPGGAKTEDLPKLEKTRLFTSEKVDLGFRAEDARKDLQEAVEHLNEQMQRNGRDLSFHMDDEINRTVITVKNLQTGEVVRQIPTEEVVRMAHSIEDMKGLLFNKRL